MTLPIPSDQQKENLVVGSVEELRLIVVELARYQSYRLIGVNWICDFCKTIDNLKQDLHAESCIWIRAVKATGQ